MKTIQSLFFVASLSVASISYAQLMDSESQHMLKTASGVVDDLSRAITDGRSAPSLKLSSSSGVVAHYSADDHEITFSKKFYTICRSFEEDSLNALAAVFSHELAHYYKDHELLVDFGFSKMQSLENVKTLSEEELELVEAEADYFGCFYAQIAGYHTLEVLPKVLDKVYAEFELNPELKGYLPLEERKNMAHEAMDKLAGFMPIYEMGNQLMLLGEYEKASECFDYISQNDFQSREILGNLGVAHLMSALEHLPKDETHYILPIVFDNQSRLTDQKTRGMGYGSSREEKLAYHLDKAEQALNLAKAKDPEYFPVLINLSVLQFLQKEGEMAYALALKARRKGQTDAEKERARMAIALSSILMDEKEDAKEILNDLKNKGDVSAQLNLKLLNGEDIVSEPPSMELPKLESVANRYASDLEDIDLGAFVQIKFSGMELYYRSDSEKHFNEHILLAGTKVYRTITTTEDYGNDTKRGISKNTSSKKVTEEYGNPEKMLFTPDGSFMIYSNPAIIFKDQNGKVAGWTVYHKS